MLSDPVLLNDWHVVVYAPDLTEGKPMAALCFTLLDASQKELIWAAKS